MAWSPKDDSEDDGPEWDASQSGPEYHLNKNAPPRCLMCSMPAVLDFIDDVLHVVCLNKRCRYKELV